MSIADRGPVPGSVPDAPSDNGPATAPEGPRARDLSGLNRGPEANEKRARDRVRLALRRARAELAELPPEMGRLRLVQEDIKRKAFLSVVFDEAKRRVLRQAPVNRAGEIRESVKVMFDAADRLHGWTESLLKLWPGAAAPQRHVAEFVYEDPLEAAARPAVEVDAPAPEVHRPQTAETFTTDVPPPPAPPRSVPRSPARDPRDMSDRLGWTNVSRVGDEDDDDD